MSGSWPFWTSRRAAGLQAFHWRRKHPGRDDAGPPSPLTQAHSDAGFSSGVRLSMTGYAAGRSPIRRRGLAHLCRDGLGGRRTGTVRRLLCAASGALASAEAPGKLGATCPIRSRRAILGRLAVDASWQGRGLGVALLRDAVPGQGGGQHHGHSRGSGACNIDDARGSRTSWLCRHAHHPDYARALAAEPAQPPTARLTPPSPAPNTPDTSTRRVGRGQPHARRSPRLHHAVVLGESRQPEKASARRR